VSHPYKTLHKPYRSKKRVANSIKRRDDSLILTFLSGVTIYQWHSKTLCDFLWQPGRFI